MVVITSRDPGAPPVDYIARSGGIFRDMTIHDFDMARFLLGEEITEVSAMAAVLVDPAIGKAGDCDSVQVMLKTASGKMAVISNSRRATYGYDQRIEVHGSKGLASAENQRPVSIEVATGAGYTRPPLHDFFMTRYTEAYAAEIAAFIEAVSGKGKASAVGRGWSGRAGAVRSGAEIGGRGAQREAVRDPVASVSQDLVGVLDRSQVRHRDGEAAVAGRNPVAIGDIARPGGKTDGRAAIVGDRQVEVAVAIADDGNLGQCGAKEGDRPDIALARRQRVFGDGGGHAAIGQFGLDPVEKRQQDIVIARQRPGSGDHSGDRDRAGGTEFLVRHLCVARRFRDALAR